MYQRRGATTGRVVGHPLSRDRWRRDQNDQGISLLVGRRYRAGKRELKDRISSTRIMRSWNLLISEA